MAESKLQVRLHHQDGECLFLELSGPGGCIFIPMDGSPGFPQGESPIRECSYVGGRLHLELECEIGLAGCLDDGAEPPHDKRQLLAALEVARNTQPRN